MSKPRNKTNRRRLHYLGVLAAAGLLTMGAAAPAMAQTYGVVGVGTDTVIGTASPAVAPTTDVIIDGANAVTWETAESAILPGSLTFNSANTLTLTTVGGQITTNLVDNNVGGTLATNGQTVSVGGYLDGGTTGLNITGIGVLTVAGDTKGTVNLVSANLTTLGTTGAATLTSTGTVTASGNVGGSSTTSIVTSGAGTFEQTGGTATGIITTNSAGGTITLNNINAAQITVTGALAGGPMTGAGNTLDGPGTTTLTSIGVAGQLTATDVTIGSTASGTVKTDSLIGTDTVATTINLVDGSLVGDTKTNGPDVTGKVVYNFNNGVSGQTAKVGTLNAGADFTVGGTNANASAMTIDKIVGGTGTAYTTVTLANAIHTATVNTASNDVTGNVAVNFNGTGTAQAFALGDIGSLDGGTNVADANVIVDGTNTTVSTLTVDNIYGNTAAGGTGATITVEDGFAMTQAGTTNTVTGKVAIVDNATATGSANVVLGVLTANSQLTYTGNAAGDGATVANTDANAATTIVNNTAAAAGSKLAVADTGASSTTTFTGAGVTTVLDTGAGAKSIVKASGDVVYDGNLGAGTKISVENGSATFGSSFVAVDAANIAELTLDSSKGGNSSLINNAAALTLTNTELDATVGNDNVIINVGSGLVAKKDVNLNGTGSGVFQVVGGPIDLDGATAANAGGTGTGVLNADGNLNFDFGGAPGVSATGFSNVETLNTSTTTSGSFNLGVNDYLAADTVNVNGMTSFGSDFAVTKAVPTTTNVGVYTQALNVNAEMTVTGEFSTNRGSYSPTDVSITIDAAGVGNGGTAITAGSFDIAQDTIFNVKNQLVNEKIKVIDGGNAATEQQKLLYVDFYGNGNNDDWALDRNNTGNYVYFDTNTGEFATYDGATLNRAFTGHARFATRYINSLSEYNPIGSVSMGLSDNREITMAMGNTLNAALMMINNPLDSIFRNNNNLHPQTESRLAKSAGDCENYGLWITPNASFRSVDGDYNRGYGDIDIKSYGVTVGFDGWINEQFRLGLFAGVNSTDLDGDFQDIDGDDFQLGVYGQAFLPQGFMLNLGVAYSWQSYDANRRVYNTVDPDFNQRIKSSFDGDTIVAAIELNKTFALDYDMFIRPAIGYTYMGTTLDSYREHSTLAASNPYNLSQRVGETDFDQHLFRIGTDIGWAVENAAVIGRAYYVGNAGDDQPENASRFRYANAGVPSFKIYGAEYDDSMANLGLTVKVAPSENSHFAIDYDALLGSNSTTHNVNLTFKYEW